MSALAERIQRELDFLNDPNARFEMGEIGRRARFAWLGEHEIPRLLAEIETLRKKAGDPRLEERLREWDYDLSRDWPDRDGWGQTWADRYEIVRDALDAAVRALHRIGYEMPTEEHNPDGVEQAAHSMQLVARDVLAPVDSPPHG